MILLELDELLHLDVRFGLVQVLAEIDLQLLHIYITASLTDLFQRLEERQYLGIAFLDAVANVNSILSKNFCIDPGTLRVHLSSTPMSCISS